MTKVVVLTSAHSPSDTRIFLKECKSLALAGYDVTLVAPHQNDEVCDGICIKAVPKLKGRLRRLRHTVWQVYGAALQEQAQIYHFHDPELIPIGLLLKAWGKKVIYDVHEDVPRQILHNYTIPLILRNFAAWATIVAEYIGTHVFDGVIAATPKIAERFPPEKTVIVQNFPLLNELAQFIERPYLQRSPSIAYVGGITIIRGAKEMVEAISLLPESLRVQLVLAGNFMPTTLEKELRQMPGAAQVTFLGFQPREGVRNILSDARAGLVTLHPTNNYLDSYPVKLFEYMSAGVPVIASDFPLWRRIIDEAQCGLLVDPLDVSAIAHAIEYLLSHPQEAEAMGARGRKAVEDCYNWKHEEAKLLALYAKFDEDKAVTP